MNRARVACFLLVVGFCRLLSPTCAQETRALDAAGADSDLGGSVWAVVPDNACVVAAVRDMAGLDSKFAKLAGRMGTEFQGLTAIESAIEIVAGIDDHGEAAVLLMPPSEAGPIADSLILLLPTTDRAALLMFLNPQPLEDGYVKVRLGGRESFAGTKGAFTVFGPDLATVKSVVTAKSGLITRCQDFHLRQMAANDVSVYADSSAEGSGRLVEMLKGGFPRISGFLKGALEDQDRLFGSARLDSTGVALSLSVDRDNGPTSSAGADVAGTLLAGLPDEPVVFAAGSAEGASLQQAHVIFEDIVTSLTRKGVILADRAADLRAVYRSAIARVARGAVSMSMLPNGAGSPVGSVMVAQARGSGALLLRDVETAVSVVRSGVFADARLARLVERLEVRRAAETLAGVPVDHIVVELSGLEGVDEAAVRSVLGDEGLLCRIAVVDESFVVATLGGGAARFSEVMEIVRSGGAPLAADVAIQMSAMGVARERCLEAYFALDRWAKLANMVCRAFGSAVPYRRVPEVNAPVALTVRSVAGGAQTEVFIPVEVLDAARWIMTDAVPNGATGDGVGIAPEADARGVNDH